MRNRVFSITSFTIVALALFGNNFVRQYSAEKMVSTRDLLGKWTFGCAYDSSRGFSASNSMTILSNKITWYYTTFASQDCSGPTQVIARTDAIFRLGGSHSILGTAVSYSDVRVYVTPQSHSSAFHFNRTMVCGIALWKKGVAMDIPSNSPCSFAFDAEKASGFFAISGKTLSVKSLSGSARQVYVKN